MKPIYLTKPSSVHELYRDIAFFIETPFRQLAYDSHINLSAWLMGGNASASNNDNKEKL